MRTVYVELLASFECGTCGEESNTDPGVSIGGTVVCQHCGASHRAGNIGFPVKDWNKLNRAEALKRKAEAPHA